MAEFLKDSQLVSEIESLIENAERDLWLITPYIKLHDRVRACLKSKKDNPNLHIVIVFGKNEEDVSKSLCKSDFEFLQEFPSITIGYEKRLHAKYYSSEKASIITSMNLHEFSQNNNIEVGIKLKTKILLADNADNDASVYFESVVDNCTIIFDKEPHFKSSIIGFGNKYSHSEVVIDESDNFFKKKAFEGKKFFQRKTHEVKPQPSQGYCIRSGKSIPFDLKRPMNYESFQSWNQHKNYDYKEKFCHKTGKPSYGKTSMRNPVLE